MFKRWFSRFAFVGAISVVLSAGFASTASAADTWLLLSDVDGHQVGYLRHVDSVDNFHLGDSRADGYGPTGCVQRYITYVGWQTQKCRHISTGAGTAIAFGYEVSEGLKYRMRLCHTIAGCAYQRFTE